MKKIIVIGCPGSGKSTFSKELSNITGIPLYHLDMMYWNTDKTIVSKEVFLARLEEAMSKESWMIDGNYGSTMELRMQACDTVIFLDYPMEICLEGALSRRGKMRSDMPWIESEDDIDEEFVRFIKNYDSESRPVVMDLLDKYADKEIIVFKNRLEADMFLKELQKIYESH